MRSYLELLAKRLDAATTGMSDEALLRAPEGKWCAADVLEHLRLTYTGTAKMLEKNRDQQTVEPVPIDDVIRAAKELILEREGFFEGMQAPPFATPKTQPDASVRTRVQQDLQRLDDALNEAEQRRGSAANQGNHFRLGPLTAEEWRHFHYVHGCHHAKQIESLRAWAAKA